MKVSNLNEYTTVHRLLRRLAGKGAVMEGQAAHLFYPPTPDWITGLYHQACGSIHGDCQV